MKNSHTEALKEICKRLKPLAFIEAGETYKEIYDICQKALTDVDHRPFNWHENYFAVSVASHPTGKIREGDRVLNGDITLITTALVFRLLESPTLVAIFETALDQYYQRTNHAALQNKKKHS